MSVNGAEEDGVDNRVEEPAWAPDGGSDSTAPAKESDGTDVATPDTPDTPAKADSAATSSPAPNTTVVTRPQVSKGATATEAGDGRDHAGSDGGPHIGTGTTRPGPVFAPAGAPQSAPQSTPLAGAAEAARGLAARVAAPFSGLGKPRTKPKAGPPKVKKPVRTGLPPRPQGGGVRPQARIAPGQATGPQTRRAQLRLDRLEPWSVMKFSFLISLVGWVILLIAVSVLYVTLSKLGVFLSIEKTFKLVTTSKTKPGSDAASWFKASRVLGYTMLIGAVNVFLMTALATIGAVLYNLVSMLAGGVEVTLKESD